MTLLIDGVAHGAEPGDVETWCGIPIPSDAREWSDDDVGSPVCPSCKRTNDEGALRSASEWIEGDPELVAVVGPCGSHVLSFGHRGDLGLEHAMAQAPRGSRFARPTPAQLIGLMNNQMCDLCIVSRRVSE